MKRLLIVGLILLFSMGVAKAGPDSSLEYNYWKPSLSGDTRVSSGGTTGTTVDYKGSLGIGDRHVDDFRFRTGSVLLSYNEFNYGATQTLSGQIVYNGVTYAANDTVTSSLKIKYYGAVWDTTLSDDKSSGLAVTFGVRGIQIDGALQSAASGSTAKSVSYAVPVVGISAKTTVSKATWFARIDGLPAGGNGYFFDGEAGVRFAATKDLKLVAAWRAFDVNVKRSDSNIHLRLSGPYGGLVLEF